MSIYAEYFNLNNQYSEKYGEKTVILMQVGAFFEIYGTRNTKRSEIDSISAICQLAVADKNAVYLGDPVLMAGFRDYTIEKHLQKLCDAGYTCAVFIQEKNDKQVNRVLSAIYSPGTYISYDNENINNTSITNHILCIWIDTFCKFGVRNIIYGMSTINMMSGESSMFEYQTEFIMNPTTFDEMERFISVYNPSEIIILSALENDSVIQKIIQYTGIRCKIHSINVFNDDYAKKCTMQSYIVHILTLFFGTDSYDICQEFREYTIATQALCYLMNFIQEHNSDLVKKISIPSFNNVCHRMVLANYTLTQLNIITTETHSGNLSSVLDFLNRTCTTMGKRLFKTILTQPTTNILWLNNEYKMTEMMLENPDLIYFFRKELVKIRDLDKIIRQLVIKRIYPLSIWNIYNSVFIIQQILVCLHENSELHDYLCDNNNEIGEQCIQLMSFIDKWLYIDVCKNMNSSMQTFEQNIIKKGISLNLDQYINDYDDYTLRFHSIQNYFNELMKKKEKEEIDYVKIHETEKSGSSLQITKKRGNVLKSLLTNEQNIPIGNNRFINIHSKDIKFAHATSSNDEITFPELTAICKHIENNKKKIDNEISSLYLQFLMELEKNWYDVIKNISRTIARVDVLQCKAYIAKEYKYCRPVITHHDTPNNVLEHGLQNNGNPDYNSYVNAKGLRHPLIEHIQQNEIYVENDICLGDGKIDGILLYGTNAVGKTSIIRALGISVILAQAGIYVPCTSFEYMPYNAIFSRILSNDNLFKGLSTFAVEMSELRIILKMANKNSLVLGDELCSGTETESALSIFTAGLMHLHKIHSSFIFATHFHEIIKYDEVLSMDRMKMMHMTVIYDRELDCLIYNRRLKMGPGNHLYGLEVCKSLYLGDDFLETAYKIRNKYNVDGRGELSYKNTTYNSQKIRGHCELCTNAIGNEIHHIMPQKSADADGFIGNVHKNHKANLMSICEKCHQQIHNEKPIEKTVRKTKTTKGYVVKPVAL